MRRWIVCSAWPYVNAIPHLGTFIHLLSADIFARYLKLKGDEVISVTGSDEHGTPIEVEAIKNGVDPKSITDKYHNSIVKLLKRYHIEFSNYTRTESSVHYEVVQNIFKKIYENGYIQKKTIKLPYCLKCQIFLPDRFIEGICPFCSYENARGDQCEKCGRVLEPFELIQSRCFLCGSSPHIKDSENWFFDLPKFTGNIKRYLDSNPQLPENAKNFSYRWIDEGLRPRAITRDNKWGIPAPFPNAEGKTIYVWFEALLGYVSATVEWAQKKGERDKWKEFWLNKDTLNVHFIGKDNIPFHTIILPSLLLATEDKYILPSQISSTEFMLFDSQKFSKSRKIGIWVDEALKFAEPEYWRFLLIAIRPETKDSNFTWKNFQSIINSDLNDSIGNFINRTLMFITNRYNRRIPKRYKLEEEDEKFIKEFEQAPLKVENSMEKIRLRESIQQIVSLARKGNQYLSSREPWHYEKTDPEKAETIIHLCSQATFTLAILLLPFIPEMASKILEQLKIENIKKLKWADAGKLYLKSGHIIGKVKPLFNKIDLTENNHPIQKS